MNSRGVAGTPDGTPRTARTAWCGTTEGTAGNRVVNTRQPEARNGHEGRRRAERHGPPQPITITTTTRTSPPTATPATASARPRPASAAKRASAGTRPRRTGSTARAPIRPAEERLPARPGPPRRPSGRPATPTPPGDGRLRGPCNRWSALPASISVMRARGASRQSVPRRKQLLAPWQKGASRPMADMTDSPGRPPGGPEPGTRSWDPEPGPRKTFSGATLSRPRTAGVRRTTGGRPRRPVPARRAPRTGGWRPVRPAGCADRPACGPPPG